MASKNLNAKWEIILEDNNILDRIEKYGEVFITSAELKKVWEPRLLTKIDSKDDVPAFLKENDLSVLAVSNGRYRISKVDPFLNIDTSVIKTKPDKVFLLPNFEVLSLDEITSETKALHVARISGMIDHVLGESNQLVSQGRFYATDVQVSLPTYNSSANDTFEMSGVQVEVDGGFEGDNTIGLFEFKTGIVDSITIRQVVYPLLHFKKSQKKEVKSYLVMVEPKKAFYHFFEVCYTADSININHEDYVMYAVRNRFTEFDDLFAVQVGEYGVGITAPFPQADDLHTVIELFKHIGRAGNIAKKDLFNTYDLVERQWDYYANSLIYLGLVRKASDSRYELTSLGKEVFRFDDREQFKAVAKIIVSDPTFNIYLNSTDLHKTEKSIQEAKGYTGLTVPRRAKTVKAWIEYLENRLSV